MRAAKEKIGNLSIEGYMGDCIFEAIRKNGDFYEKEVLEKWGAYLLNCKLIIDIGAHIGNDVLYWSEELPETDIYAYEPDAFMYDRLINNIKRNGLENVKAFNKDQEVTGGDPWIKTKETLGHIDFMKIDVERLGMGILDDLQTVFHDMYPDIWFKVCSNTCVPVIDRMEQFEYVLTDIQDDNLLFLAKKRHSQVEAMEVKKILKKILNSWYEVKQDKNAYIQKTEEFYMHLLEEEILLSDLRQDIRKLESENKQLLAERKKYKERIEKLRKTFIGKVLYRIYWLLKAAKAKFRGK